MKRIFLFYFVTCWLVLTSMPSCTNLNSADLSKHERSYPKALKSKDALPTINDLERYQLSASGFDREFCVYKSNHLSDEKLAPLVLVLHGGRGSMKNFASKTNWMRLAQKEGFIVAFLQAQKVCVELDGVIERNNFWLTDEKIDQLCENFNYHNDSDYIDLVMSEIHKKYSIDSQKIYAAGFSNGMGYIMKSILKRKPTIFAALGGAGSLTYQPYSGNTEMPVMMIIGQNDDRLTRHSNVESFPMIDQYSVFHDPTQRVCIRDVTAYLQVGKDEYDWKLDDKKMILNFYPDVEGSRSFLKYLLIKDLTHRFPNAKKMGKNLDGAVLLWNFFKQHKLDN